MSEIKSKSVTAAPKKAAAPAEIGQVVEVENISDRQINTSQGTIEVGKKGKAKIEELRQYSRFLKGL